MRVFLVFISLFPALFGSVKLGVDVFFEKALFNKYKDKNIAILTNHTGVDSNLKPTINRFIENKLNIKAIFTPEHGLYGSAYAFEKVKNSNLSKDLPIYSLHGNTRRPTSQMLEGLDVIFFDIQEIGCRAYTYFTTLSYVMEEAAKKNIEVVVLDRPNPLGGDLVDGPMLEDEWRSYIGYINVPYCHGMTIGELALYFNDEYKIQCNLTVIPMEGWKRQFSYEDTELFWIPPSPYIPEPDTPFYSTATGILGELKILNIGIGYTMPFKIVGAPWIDANLFAEKLNSQKLPGVYFHPFYFKPFYGLYKGEECQGVKIIITDKKKYKPVSVQYLILGIIKSMYPKEFEKRLVKSKKCIDLFCKANGTEKIYQILLKEKYPAWKMIELQNSQNKFFTEKRKKYLIPSYAN